MLINILLFIAGVVVLYSGGEIFIKGSTGIAAYFRIKPLIVAATIAAFATSAPEFFVSVTAALKKSESLAIGNVIGSCITNIGLVLGICALISPIKIKNHLLKKEIPMLIFVSVIIFLFGLDLTITKIEGIILLACFVLFILYAVKSAKSNDVVTGEARPRQIKELVFILAGTLLLVAGANFIVLSAVSLAKTLGISEFVIGVSLVALGTSLPELSVSAVASFRNNDDTSIGNIIGSNIFNILLIVGVVCLIQPIFLAKTTALIDMPILLVFTLALFALLKTEFTLSRKEGVLLILSYGIYIIILFFRG